MDSETIKFAVEGRIGRLTLDRPDKRNALTAAMWRALPDRLTAAAEARASILIVSGSGEHFAAGADLAEFGDLFADPRSAADASAAIAEALDALAACPIPTLALIRGACMGGGLGIALACDVRMAADTARFALPPAKLGLVYPFADVRRLVAAVGPSRAKDLLFTARTLDAEAARRCGLIDDVFAADALEAAGLAWAQAVAQNAPHSVRAAKRLVGLVADGQDVETDETRRLYADAFLTADFAEGRAAFLERRRPIFGES